MCEDSCELLPTHPEHLWVDLISSSSFVGPGPDELPSHLAGLDDEGFWGGDCPPCWALGPDDLQVSAVPSSALSGILLAMNAFFFQWSISFGVTF